MAMDAFTTELCAVDQEWAVRVKTPAGVAVEYRYATEKQARFMAAVFAMGPTRLPPANRMLATTRRKSRAIKRLGELDNVTTEEIDSVVEALTVRG